MKINKDYYYAIVRVDDDSPYFRRLDTFYNKRIYSGRHVMSAYKQIKNRNAYTITRVFTSEYERNAIEHFLYMLFFQDYNKEMYYKDMTGKEVVEAQHKVLFDIAKEYGVCDIW